MEKDCFLESGVHVLKRSKPMSKSSDRSALRVNRSHRRDHRNIAYTKRFLLKSHNLSIRISPGVDSIITGDDDDNSDFFRVF